jgi:hypothetical protein
MREIVEILPGVFTRRRGAGMGAASHNGYSLAGDIPDKGMLHSDPGNISFHGGLS